MNFLIFWVEKLGQISQGHKHGNKNTQKTRKNARAVPAGRRDDFAAEVFGVLSKGGSFYLPKHLIDAAMSLEPGKGRGRVGPAPRCTAQ